jgi:hypothetical protein
MNLEEDLIRKHRKETKKRTTKEQNNEGKNEEIQEERMRGGGESEEDLYFVSSEDEEEVTEESKINESENANDTTDAITMEEGIKATKKKMKVTNENLPFGHICDDIVVDNDIPYVRVYCQNVCGIFDREGIGLDSAFKEIKQAGADIFTFNETHGDESNATARRALRLSKQRMWRDNNEDCKIVHSSSTAPVLTGFLL